MLSWWLKYTIGYFYIGEFRELGNNKIGIHVELLEGATQFFFFFILPSFFYYWIFFFSNTQYGILKNSSEDQFSNPKTTPKDWTVIVLLSLIFFQFDKEEKYVENQTR